jgi:hypothetical protein
LDSAHTRTLDAVAVALRATMAGAASAGPSPSGKRHCRNHGGLSTGPRTTEGRAASYAARDAGRAAWWARWYRAGLEKFTGGRRKGMRDRRQMAEAIRKNPMNTGPLLEQYIERLKASRPGLMSGQQGEMQQGNQSFGNQSDGYPRASPARYQNEF